MGEVRNVKGRRAVVEIGTQTTEGVHEGKEAEFEEEVGAVAATTELSLEGLGRAVVSISSNQSGQRVDCSSHVRSSLLNMFVFEEESETLPTTHGV